jgi:TonB family protein
LLLSVLVLVPFSAVADQSGQVPAEKTAGDEEFVPPQIILGTQKQPVYPPAAFDARYSGSVLVEMTVLKNGTVGNVKVVECTRPKVGFEEAATMALKEWRFAPGMEKGQPIDVVTRLQLKFNRVGVGLSAQAQVSAGSFSVAARDLARADSGDSSGNRSSPPPTRTDPK